MKPSYHDSDSKIAIVLSLVSLVLALKKLFSVIIPLPPIPVIETFRWKQPSLAWILGSVSSWRRMSLEKMKGRLKSRVNIFMIFMIVSSFWFFRDLWLRDPLIYNICSYHRVEIFKRDHSSALILSEEVRPGWFWEERGRFHPVDHFNIFLGFQLRPRRDIS